MAISAAEARRLVMALPETVAAPHVDREAFRAGGTIFATLRKADALLNVKLDPGQQEMMCGAAPEVFSPVAGGWGRMGFTTVNLGRAETADVKSALLAAWTSSRVKRKGSAKKK